MTIPVPATTETRRVADMSVQEIKEAYAARYEGWATEEERLSGLLRPAELRTVAKIKAKAYRAIAADLRKIGGPV